MSVFRQMNISPWIYSGGGPLLLVPKQYLLFWEGANQPSFQQNAATSFTNDYRSAASYTDYDRACSVKGYLGTIKVGDGVGLILGDEPLSTSWCPDEINNAGLLMRWSFAEDEESVIAAIQNIPDSIWEAISFTFEVFSDDLCLFDSAYAGRDWSRIPQESKLLFSLSDGRYKVTTGVHEPDSETSLVIHRFQFVERLEKVNNE